MTQHSPSWPAGYATFPPRSHPSGGPIRRGTSGSPSSSKSSATRARVARRSPRLASSIRTASRSSPTAGRQARFVTCAAASATWTRRSTPRSGRLPDCQPPRKDRQRERLLAGSHAGSSRRFRPPESHGQRRGTLRGAGGAGDGIRTRDILLGKQALYRLSYSRPEAHEILARTLRAGPRARSMGLLASSRGRMCQRRASGRSIWRMDELAQRYLLLGMRLDRISPGFVDSYVGPPELAEIARGEPEPLSAELHDEALALRELAENIDGDGPATERRRLWFLGQLRAMSALARRAGGEEIAYIDLVEDLFGIPIQPTPESDLAAARERIDSA